MAPITVRSVHALWDVNIDPRSIGPNSSTTIPPALISSEEKIMLSLSLAFSTLSVASAMLASYWFIKMRRSFRHDLIMLLIQSDMFKAIWVMLSPIVVLIRGPILSDSTFCKVSSFFLSLGIEASDIAVLMIAVHSALYIFKSGASAGEPGLYRYRHYAYAIWVVFPIVMASLTLINSNDAYVDAQTFCYLPVHPLWYGLALSWIPRSLIFLFILGTCAAIYYHVRNKLNGFEEADKIRTARTFSATSGNKPSKWPKQHGIRPTPTLLCRGLPPDPSRQASVITEEASKARNQSASTLEFEHGVPSTRNGTTRFIWASIFANTCSASEDPPSCLSTPSLGSFTGPLQPLPAYLDGSPCLPYDFESVEPAQARMISSGDYFVTQVPCSAAQLPTPKGSKADAFSVFPHGPPDLTAETRTSASHLKLMSPRGQNFTEPGMLRTRRKIRRQLRYSFIYTLVYMGMWILPFISYVLISAARNDSLPPFAFICVAEIFFSSQAAVDCWLFSTRERPWKHIHGSEGSFWGSLKFWSGWHGVGRKENQGPGKTREEMVREARAAYQRREEELAQDRVHAVQGAQAEEHRRMKNWWETDPLEGAVDPAQEETSEATEDIEAGPPQSLGIDGEASHEVST